MRFLICFFILCSQWIEPAMASHEKIIYGYIEKAKLVDNNLVLSAKLDTGAKSASLNAIHIQEIQEKGESFLTFIVPSKEGDVHFKCKYLGNVSIKMRAGEHAEHSLFKKALNRPVVLMQIQLAGKARMIHVNLTNRKRFIYPLLLGREAIKAFDGIIDPALKYTQPVE